MSDKNEIVTKFGFTKAELIEYRTLMQIPDIDENGEYDENIDQRITTLRRLRLKRMMELRTKKTDI